MLQVQLLWFAVIDVLLMTQESLEFPASLFPPTFFSLLPVLSEGCHSQSEGCQYDAWYAGPDFTEGSHFKNKHLHCSCILFCCAHMSHMINCEMWQSRYIPHLKDRRGMPLKTQVEVKSQRKLNLNLSSPFLCWNSRQGIQTTRNSSKRKWHVCGWVGVLTLAPIRTNQTYINLISGLILCTHWGETFATLLLYIAFLKKNKIKPKLIGEQKGENKRFTQ